MTNRDRRDSRRAILNGWPPPWWKDTSLSPQLEAEVVDPARLAQEEITPERIVSAAEPKSPRGYCDNCRRPGYCGRLLYMGNQQWACIDCFQFLTGADDRDPAVDFSAVSGIDQRPIVPPPGPPEPPRPPRGRVWTAKTTTWLDRILDFFGVR